MSQQMRRLRRVSRTTSNSQAAVEAAVSSPRLQIGTSLARQGHAKVACIEDEQSRAKHNNFIMAQGFYILDD